MNKLKQISNLDNNAITQIFKYRGFGKMSLKTCLATTITFMIFVQLSLGNPAPAEKGAEKGAESTASAQEWVTYFVGDPYYALEDQWEAMLQALKGQTPSRPHKITLANNEGKSFEIFLFPVDGDGTYKSTKNESVEIDSGVIAAIPIDFWGETYPEHVDSLGIVRKLDPKNIKVSGETIIIDEIVFENASP